MGQPTGEPIVEAQTDDSLGQPTGEPVEELFPINNEKEPEEITEFRKKMEDPENKREYFYIGDKISTELNKDKTYKREGILHFTDSVGINAARGLLTSISNFVGQKGLENVIYDKLRNTTLQKVDIILGDNRRCYNTRLDFERNNDTLFLHIYGTVYVKKSL